MENHRVLRDFLRHKQTEMITEKRLKRIEGILRKHLSFLSKPVLRMTQEDLENLVVKIASQNLKDWTKTTELRVLKMFVRWLNERYSLGLNADIIKPKEPKNSVLPEYLITEEEFNKIINATNDEQMRLILGLLYETGARIGEILSLKIHNVSFNQYGARIIVKGKTGQRVIPVIWFANILRRFIESHPLGNPEDPLFFYRNREGKLVPMRYDVFRMRLVRLCRRAGIKKRIHAHLFRHTRLTELAGKLPEQVLKQIAGWTPDSDMAQVYIHLSQRDVEESLLSRVYGIRRDERNGGADLRICPRCGEYNPRSVRICVRCATPLDETEAMKAIISEDALRKLDDWADVLLSFFKVLEKKYPDLWKDLREVIVNKGKEYLLDC